MAKEKFKNFSPTISPIFVTVTKTILVFLCLVTIIVTVILEILFKEKMYCESQTRYVAGLLIYVIYDRIGYRTGKIVFEITAFLPNQELENSI